MAGRSRRPGINLPSFVIMLDGTAGWTRTTDLLIHSQKHLHQSNQRMPVRVPRKALRRTVECSSAEISVGISFDYYQENRSEWQDMKSATRRPKRGVVRYRVEPGLCVTEVRALCPQIAPGAFERGKAWLLFGSYFMSIHRIVRPGSIAHDQATLE
jgi:hypothetical protein